MLIAAYVRSGHFSIDAGPRGRRADCTPFIIHRGVPRGVLSVRVIYTLFMWSDILNNRMTTQTATVWEKVKGYAGVAERVSVLEKAERCSSCNAAGARRLSKVFKRELCLTPHKLP